MIACVGLVGPTIVLIARGPAAIGPGQAARDSGEAVVGSVADRLAAAEQGRIARRLREQARAERPRAEPGPAKRAAGISRRERANAITAARRFHRAFVRLELGRGGASEIRVAATPGFAETLLSEPPRVLGAAKPARRLSRLQVGRVAGSPVREVELVGRQDRGGRWEPIAIELELERGSWRVARLGL